MLLRATRSVLERTTVEPYIFLYFLAIYFLFSVIQPTVFNK